MEYYIVLAIVIAVALGVVYFKVAAAEEQKTNEIIASIESNNHIDKYFYSSPKIGFDFAAKTMFLIYRSGFKPIDFSHLRDAQHRFIQENTQSGLIYRDNKVALTISDVQNPRINIHCKSYNEADELVATLSIAMNG